MRTIKLTTGATVRLDGDLLTLLEALYQEISAKRDLDHSFEDTVREIQTVIEQMNEEERRQYLSESLFLNFVSYENERLGAYMRKLTRKA
jgi:Mg2+ and Co2+ transporter CorA